MKKSLLLFFYIVLGTTLYSQELTMRISGIKQGKGDILIAIFKGESGFPSETSKAFELLRAVPANGKAELTIKTLPAGTYAVSLFQDSNGDGVLNTNFLGIPKEGYGVSNNAFNTFSAPVYRDASFQYPTKNQLNMTLKY